MENAPKKSNKDAIYIVIILLLLGGAGYLAYAFGSLKKEYANCTALNTQLETEKAELNEIIINSGIVGDADLNDVKKNLLSMLDEYDKIEVKNEEMQLEIDAKKAEIENLLVEVETLKGQKKKDAGAIYKLKKENETLRTIMKGYIHTIDSLNTLNINLTKKIGEKDEQISTISSDLNKVQDKNKNLEDKVKLGSSLQTTAMTAVAIKVKSNGSQTETNRTNRSDQFKVCFTILENKIAKAENKTLYMRVIKPNAEELYGASPVFFQMGTSEGKACISRQVNYQNENVDVCIYYALDGVEPDPGTYIVEVYCEGHKIGKTSFALK
jgi:chromosome segregation ATPase